MVKKINSIDSWENIKNELQPYFFLIKLSPICPTSFAAENVFSAWVKNNSNEKLGFYSVDVINSRLLSNYFSEEWGVVHQSPQALFLNADLKMISTATHYNIDEKWLDKCLAMT